MVCQKYCQNCCHCDFLCCCEYCLCNFFELSACFIHIFGYKNVCCVLAHYHSIKQVTSCCEQMSCCACSLCFFSCAICPSQEIKKFSYFMDGDQYYSPYLRRRDSTGNYQISPGNNNSHGVRQAQKQGKKKKKEKKFQTITLDITPSIERKLTQNP